MFLLHYTINVDQADDAEPYTADVPEKRPARYASAFMARLKSSTAE